MAKILIIDGHPDPAPGHFIHAAASAYEEGASDRHEVRRLDVARLSFPLIRSQAEWEHDEATADILTAQHAFRWADHVVVFYPLWLGDVPALFKGFLEQVARPGFAFRYRDKGLPEKLMKGRSAHLIVTMGMPAPFYALIYRAHSLKSLKRNVFAFIGFKPVRTSIIGSIAGSAAHRDRWLARLKKMGANAA